MTTLNSHQIKLNLHRVPSCSWREGSRNHISVGGNKFGILIRLTSSLFKDHELEVWLPNSIRFHKIIERYTIAILEGLTTRKFAIILTEIIRLLIVKMTLEDCSRKYCKQWLIPMKNWSITIIGNVKNRMWIQFSEIRQTSWNFEVGLNSLYDNIFENL